MRIETLSYRDRVSGWELSTMEFFPDLTLLVGVSGVGKTKILKAIEQLRAIARGVSPRGIEWEVTFVANGGSRYEWRGGFDTNKGRDEEPVAKIIFERLIENGSTIIERDEEQILLRGNPTPKLSPFQSALSVLSREEGVGAAHEGISRILSMDDELGREYFYSDSFQELCKKYDSLDTIRQSVLTTMDKLTLLHTVDPPAFGQIVERFVEVFPQMEEVAFVNRRRPEGLPEGFRPVQDFPTLQIKEHGCADWIPENQISSGMLRTLHHLARVALWPDGTVVLIDEFENSLGVNCIDFVTRDLVSQSRRLQFIVTSHHPYIINNVSTRNWKVLTRKGPVVTAINATDLGLDNSSHQSFIKLMNLEQYREGIAVP